MTGESARAIAVAGMHRSGTSMVARILGECGVYLGEREQLVPATPTNPEGHFEHVDFLRVNKAVLAKLLGSWKRPPRRLAWLVLAARLGSLREEAARLVRDMDGRDPWAWKDPRTSLTLPFWLPLVPDLHVVVCVREPLAVARSLEARDGLSLRAGLRLWEAYNRAVMRAAPPGRTIVTRYEAYFDDPVREIRRLVERLAVSASPGSIDSAAATVRADLRRQRPTGRETLAPVLADRHRELVELADD
jgi:hypothetical protein